MCHGDIDKSLWCPYPEENAVNEEMGTELTISTQCQWVIMNTHTRCRKNSGRESWVYPWGVYPESMHRGGMRGLGLEKEAVVEEGWGGKSDVKELRLYYSKMFPDLSYPNPAQIFYCTQIRYHGSWNTLYPVSVSFLFSLPESSFSCLCLLKTYPSF